MKEHPIIFSSPMVQAILEGRKTQTRRIVKGNAEWLKNPAEFYQKDEDQRNVFARPTAQWSEDAKSWYWFEDEYPEDGGYTFKCPYGQPGDVLWVRERFFKGYVLDKDDHIPENAEDAYWYFADTKDQRPGDMSDSSCEFLFGINKKDWPSWSPSIHMPRTAARIFLQVGNVRVERVQEITLEDIHAEGIEDGLFDDPDTYMHVFMELWNQINGKRAPWESNPWVWVIEFNKIKKP